eukprot:gb/GFBE01048055.1/.p1 GENE.gb/GFBE01048055.1/~~gb/GFBE01048055.1/.p1  ORF type:complete len:430 (+),score=62.51 gb/GFBE01048055.1/:1-1290(+)
MACCATICAEQSLACSRSRSSNDAAVLACCESTEGVAQKDAFWELEGATLPCFFSMASVKEIKTSWQLRQQDVLLALPCELHEQVDIVWPLIALMEGSLPEEQEPSSQGEGASRPDCPLWSRLLEAKPFPDGEPPALKSRCATTLLPPWLLPNAEEPDSGEQALSINGKVVVLLADPRCMILRLQKVWERLQLCTGAIQGEAEEMSPEQWLEKFLLSKAQLSGDLMQRFMFWGQEVQRQPDRVRLVFVEDLLTNPEMTLRGLSRFLDHPESPLLESAIAAFTPEGGHSDFRPFPDGRTAPEELDHMRKLVSDFERSLSRLPDSLQDVWAEKTEGLLSSPESRLINLGFALSQHSPWKEPEFWLAHTAGICKPCSFAPRGLCRNEEECSFCHAPGHRAPQRRPSKKERLRRQRRTQVRYSRTPSPPGLSS